MPTYEYMCTQCASPLEVVQSIHEPSLTECPSCEGGKLRKLFGNVGVVFKGSGFYRTDNRTKSKGGGANGAGKVAASTAPGSADSGSPKESAKGSSPKESTASASTAAASS